LQADLSMSSTQASRVYIPESEASVSRLSKDARANVTKPVAPGTVPQIFVYEENRLFKQLLLIYLKTILLQAVA